MGRRHWLGGVVLAGLIAGPSAALAAGLVLGVESTAGSGDEARIEASRVLLQGDLVRLEIDRREDGSARQTIIYRGDRGQMVVLDAAAQEYLVIDEDQVAGIGAEIRGARGEIEERLEELSELEELPEEERAMVEAEIRRKLARLDAMIESEEPPAEVVRTADTGERQGYPCVRYEIRRDGRTVRELWVTDWANLGSEQTLDAFRAAARLLIAMGDLGGGRGSAVYGGVFEGLDGIEGFPVASSVRGAGGAASEVTLASVEHRDLDPGLFEPPEGYVPAGEEKP